MSPDVTNPEKLNVEVRARLEHCSAGFRLGLLALLTSTLPARSRLPYRPTFFSMVEKHLKSTNQWEDGLLTGLE